MIFSLFIANRQLYFVIIFGLCTLCRDRNSFTLLKKRENPFRNTGTDYWSRRKRLGRRLGDKDEGILSRATWSGMRQAGTCDVSCNTGRVTDWPTPEKKEKSNFHSRTIAKVWFSTFNYEIRQHRPFNYQNRTNLALGVVLKVVLYFLKN